MSDDYDDPLVQSLLVETHQGRNIFDIPLINTSVDLSNERSIPGVRERFREHASLLEAEKKIGKDIPMLTPDEIVQEYENAFDKSLTIWEPQVTPDAMESLYGPKSDKVIFHNQTFLDTLGFSMRQWTHAAPVTHTRSQRNFLQDYSHLRNPLRRFLLSQSVDSLNDSIIHFAQVGGMSCFQRCMKDPGQVISEEEKRCVHFCGESLASVRKIMVTDYLNMSENIDSLQLPTLPAGNEMGDKETGTFQGATRHSLWNQYGREIGTDLRDNFNHN